MPYLSVRASGNQDPYLLAWTMQAVELGKIQCRGRVGAYHPHQVPQILQCFKLVLDDDDTRPPIIADLMVLGAPLLPNMGISISSRWFVGLQLASAFLFALEMDLWS